MGTTEVCISLVLKERTNKEVMGKQRGKFEKIDKPLTN
jgi:hypothetical protein